MDSRAFGSIRSVYCMCGVDSSVHLPHTAYGHKLMKKSIRPRHASLRVSDTLFLSTVMDAMGLCTFHNSIKQETKKNIQDFLFLFCSFSGLPPLSYLIYTMLEVMASGMIIWGCVIVFFLHTLFFPFFYFFPL